MSTCLKDTRSASRRSGFVSGFLKVEGSGGKERGQIPFIAPGGRGLRAVLRAQGFSALGSDAVLSRREGVLGSFQRLLERVFPSARQKSQLPPGPKRGEEKGVQEAQALNILKQNILPTLSSMSKRRAGEWQIISCASRRQWLRTEATQRNSAGIPTPPQHPCKDCKDACAGL